MLDPSLFYTHEVRRGSGIHAGWVNCVKHPDARYSLYDATTKEEARAFINGYAAAVRAAPK